MAHVYTLTAHPMWGPILQVPGKQPGPQKGDFTVSPKTINFRCEVWDGVTALRILEMSGLGCQVDTCFKAPGVSQSEGLGFP